MPDCTPKALALVRRKPARRLDEAAVAVAGASFACTRTPFIMASDRKQMTPPTEPNRTFHVTEDQATSIRSDADETVRGVRPGRRCPPAAPGFGPPAGPARSAASARTASSRNSASGGMGAVYAALDTRLDRRLALKVMLPQFAADPRREGAVPARGPGRREDQARQRRHRVRGRRARRRAVHRDAVPRRLPARRVPQEEGRPDDPAGRCGSPRRPRRAGRGPRARPGSPRHQARQPVARGARTGASRCSTSGWPSRWTRRSN